VEGGPVYGSTGVRHEGGVILIQAGVRNGRTCRADAMGDAQAGSSRKRLSTEAGHRGGVAHRKEERSVIEPDRRGGVVRVIPWATREGRTCMDKTKPFVNGWTIGAG